MDLETARGEIEELKSAMEKLRAAYNVKSELSDSLRRAHEEKLKKIEETKREIDKQSVELHSKSEEISVARRMYDELKVSFREKESVVKCLSSANDKLRSSFGDKVVKLEAEILALASTLDETKAKASVQEKKITDYEKMVSELRSLLSESQKKCVEAERRAKEARESRAREEMLLRLEEESSKVIEQLKWKKEQFDHLKEAHDKLQDQLRVSRRDWEVEKSGLVHEICTLQANLDSQTRIAQDLGSRLHLCNQALAHEESRRKLLEIQVSESRVSYESVIADCEEARAKIELLTKKRDEEIASVRNLLASKETHLKEMEFLNQQLVQGNQELHASLKEIQEAQITEAGAASSLKSLRHKLRRLEEVHKDCSVKLKEKEAEWSLQIKKLENELDGCLSQLDLKEKQVQELQSELERNYTTVLQLKVENEEMSIVLVVVLSGISEACLDLENLEVETEHCLAKKDGQIGFLTEQLEKKSSVLVLAQDEIERKQEAIATLLVMIENLQSVEIDNLQAQKEIDRYKELFGESTQHLELLKKQASQKESSLEGDLRKVTDALNIANTALNEKGSELNKIEFELQHWKTVAERTCKLKLDAEDEIKALREECQLVRKELDASITSKMEMTSAFEQKKIYFTLQLEEREHKIKDLQIELGCLREGLAHQLSEAVSCAKSEVMMAFDDEQQTFFRLAEQKDRKLESLQTDLASLEQELSRTKIQATTTLEKELGSINHITKEKDKMIDDLQKHIVLQEQLAKSVETAITLELADTQLQIDVTYKSWDKIATVLLLNMLEIEYKNVLIREQEEQLEREEKCYFEERRSREKITAAHVLSAQETQYKNTVINELEKQCTILSNRLEMEEKKTFNSKNSWEKVTDAHILNMQDLEHKNAVIHEIEEDRNNLKQKLEVKNKEFFSLQKYVQKLEDEVEKEKYERKLETDQFETELGLSQLKQRDVEAQLVLNRSKLKQTQEDVTLLLSQRESIETQVAEFSTMVGELHKNELPNRWKRVMEKVENTTEFKVEDFSRLNHLGKCKPLKSKCVLAQGIRSPLKEQNGFVIDHGDLF